MFPSEGMLLSFGKQSVTVYRSLGSAIPRLGFAPLARRWERFYVIRNLDDAITHLPPRALGYCHVGNLIEVGVNGKYSAIDAHRPESYLAEL